MNGTIDCVESQGKTTSPLSFDLDDPERLQECHGCGQVGPDVDLWAENTETGEELWLCLACGE